LLETCAACLEQGSALLHESRDRRGILARRAYRNRRPNAERAERDQRGPQRFRRSGNGILSESFQRVVGGGQCAFGLDGAALQLREIDCRLSGALRRIEVVGCQAARDAEKPPRIPRLLEQIEQRDLVLSQIRRPRMLDADSHVRIEASGHPSRVIKNLLLNIAERRPDLSSVVHSLDAEHDVERREFWS
jgi:hypothetical protein